MIATIVKKEFLTNLVSPRFLIGFVLCLVLIPFSLLISVSNYRDRSAQYRLDRDAAEKAAAEVRVYSALRPEVVLPPEPLSVFGKGISDQVGSRVRIWIGDKPFLAAGKTAAGDNPFLASFFSVDFVDIVAIIFSLLALIFSYDAITREKEDGTLGLQMSNALPRSTALVGKLLGVVLTLLPILAFSFLLSVALVLLARDVAFSAVQWGRIGLLVGASLVYLVVFVFIGLLVSARSKSSVTSLVLCLFLWVLFVFVVPVASSNFAESFVAVESRDNLERVLRDIDKAREAEILQGYAAAGLPRGYSCWWCSSGEDGRMETYGNPREEYERFLRRSMISEPIRLEYAEKRWAPQKSYLDSLARQARAAERLALLSPTGVFRTVASAICRTDLASHQAQMDRTRRYRETVIGWFRSMDIFRSYAWVTPVDPDTFLSEDALIEKRTGGRFKTAAEFDAWEAEERKAGRAWWEEISQSRLHGDSPEDFPFLDISDMPLFAVRKAGLFPGLESSAVGVGLLLAEAVLLFYAGFVAFIRYDVR